MKTLLLLLLTCLPLCAATTYPLLSTTTDRTVTGGVTNMSLLNANQTFTGTNTFSGSLIASGTNLTGFAQEWIIYNGPPNVLTNVTGGYGSSNLFHTQTIPAGIMGSNGMLGLYYDVRLVNAAGLSAATTTRGFTYHYNEGTNIISRFQFTSAATAATNQFSGAAASLILRNTGTLTNNATGLNQIEGQPFGSGAVLQNGTLQMDTSVNWTLALYGNVGTASTETNEYRNLIIVVKRFP